MRLAIYPGSFDPITNGHLDVIHRACRLFDELIVAVALNDQKHTSCLFTIDERITILTEACEGVAKVRVAKLNGLLVDFARACGASAIVRGLRAVSDFEFEFQMALMNRKMEPDIETIFLMPKEEYTYLSSRIVKEIARLGGNVDAFVPPSARRALAKKLSGQGAGEARVGGARLPKDPMPHQRQTGSRRKGNKK
jgi:pantetheine-phosphate adenylyltransferase